MLLDRFVPARIRPVLRRLQSPSSPLAGVFRLGGATALGQIFTVVATPLLTRLYSPEDMGRFGLFQSYLTLAAVGVCLRYEMGIVSAPSEEEASDLLTLSLLASIPIGLLAGVVLWLLIRFDSWSFGALPEWSSLAMTVACVGAGAFVALRFWFARHGDFHAVGRAMVQQGIARTALPILAGLGHIGWVGLLLGELGGRTAGVTTLRSKAIASSSTYAARFHPATLIAVARRNWKYPTIVLPSSLVDGLATAITVPLVASLFGAATAGQAFLAQRIVTLPAAFIAASVADVAHSTLAERYRSAPEHLTRSVIRVGRMLAFAGLVIYVPVALIAPWGAPMILGERWRTTGLLIAVFTPLAIVSLIGNPLSRLFVVVNRPELKLISDVALVIAPILALITARVNGLSVIGWSVFFVGFSVVATLIGIGLAIYAVHHPAALE